MICAQKIVEKRVARGLRRVAGMSLRNLESNSYVAGAAIFISFCALVVSAYEVRTMRQQQKMSVWPYLESSYGNKEDGVGIQLTNKGIGPALVKSVVMSYEDTVIKNWDQLFKTVAGPGPHRRVTSFIHGRAIMAGETIELVKITDPDLIQALMQAVEKIELTFQYGSVYGDSWHLEFGKRPVKKELDIVAGDQFEN